MRSQSEYLSATAFSSKHFSDRNNESISLKEINRVVDSALQRAVGHRD